MRSLETKHFLTGYIAEVCDDTDNKEKPVMIIEVVQPSNGSTYTYHVFIRNRKDR